MTSTNYLVLCNGCNPSCNCCKSCKNAGLALVEYRNQRGYLYKAPHSVTLQNAMTRLKDQGVTDFGLIAYRGKMTKKEMTIVSQSLKRSAPSEQMFDEEALIKRLRASLIEEVKIEVSKESSQCEQKISRLEEDHNNKFSKFEEDHKKILRLEENVKKVSLQVSDNDKQISRIIKNQEARDEKIDRNLIQISLSNSKLLQEFSTEMSKNLQDGLQNVFTQLLAKQAAEYKEALKLIAPKKQEQTRDSNSSGSTFIPSSAGKSNPKAKSSNQTDQFLRQVFGNSFKQSK